MAHRPTRYVCGCEGGTEQRVVVLIVVVVGLVRRPLMDRPKTRQRKPKVVSWTTK